MRQGPDESFQLNLRKTFVPTGNIPVVRLITRHAMQYHIRQYVVFTAHLRIAASLSALPVSRDRGHRRCVFKWVITS